MLLHVVGMLAAVSGLLLSLVLAVVGRPWRVVAMLTAGVLAALVLERLVAGLRAAAAFRDPAGLGFAPVHLLRDLAWAAALGVWVTRRLCRRRLHPGHSMRPGGPPPAHRGGEAEA